MIDRKSLKTLKSIVFRYLNSKEYKVFIFGSRAIGFNHKFSDVDIGIVGKKKIPHEKLYDIIEELEESDIPYLVDVVDFSTADKKFKDLALKKVMYLN